METPDPRFLHALLYLQAAGHDTGPETRAQLRNRVRAQLAETPCMEGSQLLSLMPQWFPLAKPHSCQPLPDIDRASMGYPGD